jgi:hypothetical protein
MQISPLCVPSCVLYTHVHSEEMGRGFNTGVVLYDLEKLRNSPTFQVYSALTDILVPCLPIILAILWLLSLSLADEYKILIFSQKIISRNIRKIPFSYIFAKQNRNRNFVVDQCEIKSEGNSVSNHFVKQKRNLNFLRIVAKQNGNEIWLKVLSNGN